MAKELRRVYMTVGSLCIVMDTVIMGVAMVDSLVGMNRLVALESWNMEFMCSKVSSWVSNICMGECCRMVLYLVNIRCS